MFEVWQVVLRLFGVRLGQTVPGGELPELDGEPIPPPPK
jgi:hypothetical protein